jgi:catechol 2,3-dioxygenase
MTIADQARSQSIDARTTCGVVGLTVADLDRSLRFYTGALGLAELARSGGDVVLGAADTPLLALTERKGAMPWMVDAMTGLYHFAILAPSRAALGGWLKHYFGQPYPPPGQGDHRVSEALYLRDPDGHGIEMYADRPRESWEWQDGRVRMGGGPVDVRGMIAEHEQSGQPWKGMSEGTTIGHVHLQAGSIAEAEQFYHRTLGLDVVAGGGTGKALFVSAGGYHHHIGLNTWHSENAPPAPEDVAGLRFFSLALPDTKSRGEVVARVDAAGLEHTDAAGAVVVRDPWGHKVALTAGRLVDARAVQELSRACA